MIDDWISDLPSMIENVELKIGNQQSTIGNRRSAILLTLWMTLAVACANGPERTILAEFFGASRLRDRTALQGFATVPFEPHVQGIVTGFTIARVGPDEHKPLSKLGSEIGIVELSVDDPRNPIDPRGYRGEMVSKEVTIYAPVRLPSGQIAQETMNVILQRAILEGDREVVGRWIVTGIVTRDRGSGQGLD
jgi:hypothetical protein